ncbi:hypothetical protein GMRT_13837 [Giardia muris]|uniref:Uncharacterized protein n=1 Tax=Giardia muris TaxID=5742 RepID=A0A4Z1SUP6_GIAMU|nr:hypothetical protein GMRT_13837 [Giardia muris]|eukprot:TNJ27328.1 hypothetical protein GMRT_13837 [Giardia muris]
MAQSMPGSARVIITDSSGLVRVLYPMLSDLPGGQAHRLHSTSRHSVPITAIHLMTDTILLAGLANGYLEAHYIANEYVSRSKEAYHFPPPHLLLRRPLRSDLLQDAVSQEPNNQTPIIDAKRIRSSHLEIRQLSTASPNHLVFLTSDSRIHHYRLTLTMPSDKSPEDWTLELEHRNSFQMWLPETPGAYSEAYHLISTGERIYAVCGGLNQPPVIYDAYTGTPCYSPLPPPPTFPAGNEHRFYSSCFCHDLERGLFLIGDVDGWIHCYLVGIWGDGTRILDEDRLPIDTRAEFERATNQRLGRPLNHVSDLKNPNTQRDELKQPYRQKDGVVRSAALWRLRQYETKVCALEIVHTSEDSYIVASDGLGTCAYLSLETGKEFRRLRGHAGAIKAISHVLEPGTPPTPLLFTCCYDKFVRAFRGNAMKAFGSIYVVSNPTAILSSWATCTYVEESSMAGSITSSQCDQPSHSIPHDVSDNFNEEEVHQDEGSESDDSLDIDINICTTRRSKK